jgi:xylulokinase
VTQDDALVIGLDCSTHGAKAIAWDAQGRVAMQARRPYPLHTPRPGWYEQDPRDWARAAIDVLAEIGHAAAGRVRAVGVTHQRETFAGIDRHGAPVRNAILWMDERAWQQVEDLRRGLGDDRFHRITGKPLSLTPAVSKLLWLRDHEPKAFASAHRWLEVHGFVVRALTGADVTSVGAADPTGLVDITSADWSQEILEFCGIARSRLPALLPSGTMAGTIRPAVAANTGLEPGTPVVATAGDGQVAALGCQVCDLDRAYLNLGTAIVSGTVSPFALIDRAFRTMSGAQPGTFLLESDLKGGTFTIDWLCDTLLRGTASARDLEQEAASLPPGAGGLVLVPYFATVMNPYWDDDASGILVGLRGQHTPAHLYRAILEGIALEQRLHLREIERASGHPLSQVNVTGGGASSDLWCSILADALGRPVVRTASAEATSLGAAMMAAAAVGMHSSILEASRAMGGCARTFLPGPQASLYARLFDEVYCGLYPSLREALSRLAAFSRSAPT